MNSTDTHLGGVGSHRRFTNVGGKGRSLGVGAQV